MIAAMLFAVTAGSVPGSETDLLKELSGPGSGCEADLHEELGGGQVWRHPHPVGIGHAQCFPANKVLPLWVLGMKFLERFIVHAFLGENGHDVDALGNRVLDGVLTVLSEVDQGSSGNGSCTVASNEAAHVPHGCSSSMFASKGFG